MFGLCWLATEVSAQSTLDKKLIAAISKHDIATVNSLLGKGANPNADDGADPSQPALLLAIVEKQLPICEGLLAKGAKVETADVFGNTALVYAIESSSPEIMKLLLSRGANVNAHNNENFTPLHSATVIGSNDAIATLLDKGALIDAKSNTGMTPFIESIGNKNLPAAKRLADRGADINSTDDDGNTSLIIASSKNDLESVNFLISRKANLNAKNKLGESALSSAAGDKRNAILSALKQAGAREIPLTLIEAVRKGDKTLVRKRLDEGEDPNSTDNEGRTALYYTDVSILEYEIAVILLDKGADPNFKDKKGVSVLEAAKGSRQDKKYKLLIDYGAYSPELDLFQAVVGNDMEETKRLLASGVDINSTNFDDNSPLVVAIEAGNLELAKLLIDHKANVNFKGKRGKTLLMSAMRSGSIDAISLLLEKGSDIRVRDEDGKNVLMTLGEASFPTTLLSKMNIPLTDMLKNRDKIKDIKEEGDTERVSRVSKIAKLLIEKGADVRAKSTEGGNVALESIVAFADGETLRIAMDRGAISDINFVNQVDETVLVQAVADLNLEKVRILLEKGADPNLSGKKGHPPLYYAMQENKHSSTDHSERTEAVDRIKILQLLILKGAKVDVEYYDGETPLSIAMESGNSDIVDTIRNAGGKLKKPNPAFDLSRAVEREDYLAVKTMLKNGVNPNAPGALNWTPLITASYRGSLEFVKLLIAHGAKVDLVPLDDGYRGDTALAYAAEANNIEVVKYLLKNGANPNSFESYGQSPLSQAASKGAVESGEILLAAGAKFNYAWKEGSVLVSACRGIGGGTANADRFARMLLKRGAKVNMSGARFELQPLYAAISIGRASTAKILLDAGANVNIRSESGETLLMVAVGSGSVDAVKLILKQKIDINAKAAKNITALKIANNLTTSEIADLLKSAGAKE